VLPKENFDQILIVRQYLVKKNVMVYFYESSCTNGDENKIVLHSEFLLF